MYVIDLELFLRKNKLKQKELAEILGVTPNYISEVYKGKSKLSQKRIETILSKGTYDVSMIRDVKAVPSLSSDTVTMSREVFDLICSQQRTIETQQTTIDRLSQAQGGSVPEEDPVASADVI